MFAAIDEFVADPRPDRLRKLTGRAESRLRVGDWRVLCVPDFAARTLNIQRVLPRGRAYDR